MVLLLQYCGKYHFVTSHLFRNKAIGFNFVTVPGSAKSNIYSTALGQLDTRTQLHVQDCPGGGAGTHNIVCGHPHTSQSQ